MAKKKGKITKIDIEKNIFNIDNLSGDQTITKKFKSLNLKVGDSVEYEKKGPNLDIEKSKEEIKDNKSRDNKKIHPNLVKVTQKKGETNRFIYPFNFVQLGSEEKIESSRRPIKKGNNTGKIECKIINLTPISVGSEKSSEFIKYKDRYVIPASSLKGEIRNIIEVLTNSCIRNVKEKHLYVKIPEKFKACSDSNKLCFSCRMFGSVGNDQEMKIEKSYRGRVYFSDAIAKSSNIKTTQISLLLGRPRVEENEPALNRFYLDNSKKIRGRKFFWNQKEMFVKKHLISYFPLSDEKVDSTIAYIDINQEFNFEVHFENLDDEELGTLIYSLELEKDLLHRFGRAKAYGFGSCKIEIENILLDNQDKYTAFSNLSDKKDKNTFLKDIRSKYINSTEEQVKELKKILEKDNGIEFAFPKPFPERNVLNKFKGKKLPKILEYYKEKK